MKQIRPLSKIVSTIFAFVFVAGCAPPAAPEPTSVPVTATQPAALPTTTSIPTEIVPPSPTPPAESVASQKEVLWATDGGPNTFVLPTELTLDSEGNVYVIDGGNHRVQKFDPDGNLLLLLGSQGSEAGQFFFRAPPAHYGAVAADQSDNIYVTDHYNRIQKFDSDGNFIMQFGQTGYGDGEFANLYGIAVDGEGNIYTTDWNQYNVQKFDAQGNFLMKWEVPSCQTGGTSMPSGIALDGQGNVYVTNDSGNCIQQFDAQGNLVNQWGTRGEAEGQVYRPMGIVVDAQGNVYVAENRNGRIQKFDSSGKSLAWYDGFEYPIGLGLDAEGNIYVVEVVKALLVKFRPQ